jgi:cell division protein FtsB
MERMTKWDLLHIGTAYLEVHTFKWKDYITVKDFSTTTNALSKEVLELEEENKKLKEENEKLKKENISLHLEIEDMKDDGELSYEEKLLYD